MTTYNDLSRRVSEASKKYNATKSDGDLDSLRAMLDDEALKKINDPKMKQDAQGYVSKVIDNALSASINDKIKQAYQSYKKDPNSSDQSIKQLVSLVRHEDMIGINNQKSREFLVSMIGRYADMIRTEAEAAKSMNQKKE